MMAGRQPKRVLFAVDDAAAHGLGHVARSTALAHGLVKEGVECVFLSSGAPSAEARLQRVGAVSVRRRSADLDPAEILDAARGHDCSGVVIDSYGFSQNDLGRLDMDGLTLLVIDDLARHAFSADVVVNGAVHAPQLPYRSTNAETVFLLGPAHALLRDEFENAPPRATASRCSRILVTLGGGATAEATREVVKCLDDVAARFDVTLVIGPMTEWDGMEDGRHTIRTVVDPPSMRVLMQEADLAIAGGGQTLYELAAMGTPAIALELAGNQAGSVRGLAAAGVIRSAGEWGRSGTRRTISALVGELAAAPDARSAMSAAGQRLVDGRGAARVAAALVAAMERTGTVKRA